jgi:DNA-binding LacI/PurR family transcriptional regulator/signal transduction histidine kinase/CheY-like chemotaxis protein
MSERPSSSLVQLARRHLRDASDQPRRPTIALLLDYMSYLDGAYQSRVSETFHEAAEKLGVDLLILFGRALDEPSLFSRPHNGIFELIERRNVDGVVMASGLLAAHCGLEGVTKFAEGYAGVARVSLGLELPGVPSVIVDNEGAMDHMVEHLIVEHGLRRIAFLAGTPDSPESEARLAGYRRALERHGIAYEPSFVGHGRFMHWPARQTVGEILQRVGSIDGLVAANDAMALGAIAALRGRGLSVPGDVVVTGFDDAWLGRLGDAALTTVSQPFKAIAEASLRLVLGQAGGSPVEAVARVPANLVVRRSCGCVPKRERTERALSETKPHSPLEHLHAHEAEIAQIFVAQLGSARTTRIDDARLLFEALRAELEGCRREFLTALEVLLRGRKRDHERHQLLHNVIDGLREEFRGVATRELDDIWYSALSRVSGDAMTAGVERRIELDNEYSRLLSTADRVSMALDLPALGEAIVASLENVGLATAFISRFVEHGTELEPLAGIVDGKPVEAPGVRYSAFQLIPPGSLSAGRRSTLVLFPLVFETQWLGVAAFEHVVGGHGYQLLRDQYAAALGHVALHQQILHKTMLHDRSVQERQATNRRIEALSVLAGGVAHDLNNTLGPLVALPEIAIEELSRLSPGPEDRQVLGNLLTDMQCIKSAGVRAAQTIKDLLTLGRQGRAPKESLDLNRIVEEGLADPLRLIGRAHPLIEIRRELHPERLDIMAAEAHVTRAVTNLVNNAVEAIGPNLGSVAIVTGFVRLSEALSGYETILPGEYATVSVSDSGAGIARGEIERVFEPFFSRKRVGEQSGSGLGLAIVHGVAKEHEGFVDLRSAPGQGTTFTLYFPLTNTPSRVESVPPSAPRGPARILVIDDDPIQGRTARRVLKHLGYDVDVVESGARALEILLGPESNSVRYDLLLLDVMLNEELDGLQILRRVRQELPRQKAVIASGQTERGRAEEDLKLGISWLAKPYTTEGLTKAMATALDVPERSSWSGRRASSG